MQIYNKLNYFMSRDILIQHQIKKLKNITLGCLGTSTV